MTRRPGDGKAWPHYVEYGPLYAGTYGFRTMGNIHGQLWEFFPNTGRYYFIPVLPQGNEPMADRLRMWRCRNCRTRRVKRSFSTRLSRMYEGDALVCLVGDTLTVQNTNENEDVTESYLWNRVAACFLRNTLSGKVAPHSYLVGKIEDQGRRLWLQANTEYPDRETVLNIGCARRPELQVRPPAAEKARAMG